MSQSGPVSFVVKLQDGRTVRRHQDHTRARYTPHMISPPDVEVQPVVGEEKESTTEERTVPTSSSDQE